MAEQKIFSLININSPQTQQIGEENSKPFDWVNLANKMRSLADEPVYSNENCRLKDIFVPQQFLFERHGEQSSRKTRPDLLDELVNTDWERLKEKQWPLLLFGTFGNGKSSALKMLASKLASDWIPANGKILAVYVPLRDLAIWDKLDLRAALANQLQPYGDLRLESLPHPTLFLFDGFDELSLYTAEDDQVRNSYGQLCSLLDFRNIYIAISSRPLLFLGKEQNIALGTPRLTIEPLDRDQIETWLQKWNRTLSNKSQSITSSALAQRELLAVVENPLLLYLVAIIFDSELREERSYSRSDVYKRFFDFTAKGKYFSEESAYTKLPANYREILRRVALVMHQHGEQHGEGGELISLETLKEHLPEWEETKVAEILKHGSLVVVAHFFQEAVHDDRKFIEFTHKSFREFLLAEHLLDLLTNDTKSTTQDAWFLVWRRAFSPDVYAFLREMLTALPAGALRRITEEQAGWAQMFLPSGVGYRARFFDIARTTNKSGDVLYQSTCASATAIIVQSAAASSLTAPEGQTLARQVAPSLLAIHSACLLSYTSSLWRAVVQSCRTATVLPADASCLDLSEIYLENGLLSSNFTLVGMPYATMHTLEAQGFAATQCNLTQSEWQDSKLINSTFDVCDWSRSTLDTLTVEGCTFKDCTFATAKIIDCHFSKCRILGANLKDACLDSVAFYRCEFEDLVGTWDAVGLVKFENCTFAGIQWPHDSDPNNANIEFVACRGDLPPWLKISSSLD